MPKAKLICRSVEILCGRCGETIPEPVSGSFFWALTEIVPATVAVCDSCGKENAINIPARVATE